MITIHWLSIVMFYLMGAFISCVLGIVILTTSIMLNGSPYFIRHKKQTFIDFIITCLCSWYGVFAIIVWFLGELESYFRKRKKWYAMSVIQYLQEPTLTPKRTILKNYFQIWYNRKRRYKVTNKRMAKHFDYQYECEADGMEWEYGQDILINFLRRKGC